MQQAFRWFSLLAEAIAAAAVALAMVYTFLPTWGYIEWMKIRNASIVRNPFTGNKIPLRDVFSIYAVFMLAVAGHAIWQVVDVWRNGPARTELERVAEAMEREIEFPPENGDAK